MDIIILRNIMLEVVNKSVTVRYLEGKGFKIMKN